MTRSIEQTVALAIQQAAQLAQILPETRALLELREHQEAQELLHWMDAAPASLVSTPALLEGQTRHAADTLALLIPGADSTFWAEYMRQRCDGREKAGLPPTPTPAKTEAAPKPPRERNDLKRRTPLTAGEIATLDRLYTQIEGHLRHLRAADDRPTWPAIAQRINDLGVQTSPATINSLGNGYARNRLHQTNMITTRVVVAREIFTALELLTAPEPAPTPVPTPTPEPEPTPPAAAVQMLLPAPEPITNDSAVLVGRLLTAVAASEIVEQIKAARPPLPPRTDKERRELAEQMLVVYGRVNVREFRVACKVSQGAAIGILKKYPFLGYMRGDKQDGYFPRAQ